MLNCLLILPEEQSVLQREQNEETRLSYILFFLSLSTTTVPAVTANTIMTMVIGKITLPEP